MYPKDAITIAGYYDSSEVLIDHTGDDFTLLSQHITVHADADLSGSQQVVLLCDDNPFQIAYQFNSGIARTATGWAGTDYTGHLVCSGDLVAQNSGGTPYYYEITYIPYDITAPEYAFVGSTSYGDWLLGLGVVVFLLSFVTWGYLWSVFKPKQMYAH